MEGANRKHNNQFPLAADLEQPRMAEPPGSPFSGPTSRRSLDAGLVAGPDASQLACQFCWHAQIRPAGDLACRRLAATTDTHLSIQASGRHRVNSSNVLASTSHLPRVKFLQCTSEHLSSASGITAHLHPGTPDAAPPSSPAVP